jgi:hypothetical protein
MTRDLYECDDCGAVVLPENTLRLCVTCTAKRRDAARGLAFLHANGICAVPVDREDMRLERVRKGRL